MTLESLYDTDFNGWIDQTLQLLRDRNFDEVDWINVMEEIELLAHTDERTLDTYSARILELLLLYAYQPEKRCKKWLVILCHTRWEIKQRLKDSPKLKEYLEENLQENYEHAVKIARIWTGMDKNCFPSVCRYSVDQLLDEDFLG